VDKHYITLKHFLKDLAYIIIISVAVAVFLTLTGITEGPFAIVFIVSLSFGVSIFLIIHFLLWVFKPEKMTSVVFIVIIGIFGGMLLGLQIGPFVVLRVFSVVLWQQEKSLFQTIVLTITIGSIASYFFYSKSRLRVSMEETQQERIKRLSSEKQAIEANLRLLQAQIEPHFLFNTLSNILSLLDTDLKKGRSMLMDLTRYLRTTLPKTRGGTTTLGQEMEMIKAYLNILKVRMEDRLHYRIDVPDSIKDHTFPPMLIQPLVENAIKHGIEPKVEGGEVTIRARGNGDVLRVEITDTGTGLHEDGTGGFGLSNVRERLQSLYGDRGRLILEENQPSGLKAIIEVPHASD
jgi:sensor histidine kinase YesM